MVNSVYPSPGVSDMELYSPLFLGFACFTMSIHYLHDYCAKAKTLGAWEKLSGWGPHHPSLRTGVGIPRMHKPSGYEDYLVILGSWQRGQRRETPHPHTASYLAKLVEPGNSVFSKRPCLNK